MKTLCRYIIFAAAFLGIAGCASAPPSHDAERARARAGYSALDSETSPAASTPSVTSAPTAAYSGVSRPILMALPAASGKGSSPMEVVSNNPFAKAVMEGINEYLTEKGYEVRSLEGSEDLSNLIQMQGDISGNGDDMSYIAGLALGADVYIKFSGSIKNDMVNVELSAYETSTARQLGSKTGMVQNHGNSKDKQRYLVISAAKKALPALEKTILSYWDEDAKKGVQYKVVLRIGERFQGSGLEDLQDQSISTLRSTFKSIRVNNVTERTIDIIVYADPEVYPDAYAVYSAVKSAVSSSAQAKKNNIVNKLIILELN